MDKISIMIDKQDLEQLIKELPKYINDKWKHLGRLEFEYTDIPRAKIIIPYNQDSWRKGYLEFGGITTVKSLEKDYLTIDERHFVLEKFLADILNDYSKKNNIKLILT